MDAAAYVRYRTDQQDANSIAYQLNKIGSYCKENSIHICAHYINEGSQALILTVRESKT